MKNLDNRIFLNLSFPLIFAFLFTLLVNIVLPRVSPGLAMLIWVLFTPFLLFSLLIQVPYQNLPVLLEGLILFILLSIALQYVYMRILSENPNKQYSLIIVVTYIQTGLLTDMYLLFHHFYGL